MFMGPHNENWMFQQLCASPALEPYKGTLYGNGSPISNAKATLLSYSSFTIPTYLKLLMIYGWQILNRVLG